MKHSNLKIAAALGGVLAGGSQYGALAAQIEEVVVTATKRGALDVQSLPESIHAIGGEQLEQKSQLNFEDFAGSVPGLQFQDLGPGDKEYIIRGINGSGPSVVGAYFGEYVISANDQQDGGGKNAPIKLIDMERIEVLNGPQGTLYGANSMAGNIRFIPRSPGLEEVEAGADADLSGTDGGGFNYNVSGVINVPLIANVLAARIAGWRTDSEGWINQPRREQAPNVYGLDRDINTEETDGGRILVRWTPNERFSVDAMYLYQDTEIGGSSRFTAAGTPAWPDQSPAIAALGVPFTPLPGLPALTPTGDFVNTDITATNRDDVSELFGATLTFDAGFGTFSVAASHFDHDIEFVFDSTPILLFFGVPIPGVTVQPQSYETTMVEARFASDFEGPINFVAGLYYQNDENDFEVNVTTTDGAGNPVPWDPLDSNDVFFNNGTAFFGRFRNDEIEQKAVFGEVNWDVTERLHLLAGFRWFQADLESVQATTHRFLQGILPPSPVAGVQIGTTVNGNAIGLIEQDDDTIRPKASLSFDLTDDVLLYTLYSEGFRVGGINNGNQPFAPGIPATFQSDELQNLEFGVKSRWLDNRVQANATLFFIDWDNIQVEPRDPVGNIPFTTNGGAAEVNGLEWTIEAWVTEQLRLDFSGTWFFDHALTEDQPVLPGASPLVIIGQEGDDIPNVPELSLYAAVAYETQIFGRPLTLSADLNYRDSTNTEFRPDSPFNIRVDSFVLANLYAAVQVTEQIRVGAYIKNVGDELGVIDGIGTLQDPQAIIGARPRTFGATMQWKF